MVMMMLVLYLIFSIVHVDAQLIFTSLTMPHKESPSTASSSSSSSSSNHNPYSPSMMNYYHHPYYHLAFNDSDSIPDEQRLMAQLLRNYDPSARPVYNASNTVSVAFGIALTQLSDMVGLPLTLLFADESEREREISPRNSSEISLG